MGIKFKPYGSYMVHWLNLLDSCALSCDCCNSESIVPDTEHF